MRISITTKLTFALCLLTAAPAMAAGYGLREFSANAMGAAFAGSAATGSDASYLAYNPATASLAEGTDYAIAVIGIMPQSSASYTTALTSAGTPAGGSASQNGFISYAFIPELAMRTRLSDQLVLGLTVQTPWGLSTNYPANSSARYYAQQTKLLTFNISPSLSYELSSSIAIAAGVQIQYAKGTLTSAIDIGTLGALLAIPGSIPGTRDGSAAMRADDWATGFTLGVLAHLSDDVTAGLSYRSQVSHTLSGSLAYTLDSAGLGRMIQGATGYFTNANASVKLATPDTVNFGLSAKLSPEVTALFELDWINWSKFGQLQVVSANPAQPDDITQASWKAGWFISAGAEYWPEGNWSFKAGVAYDQSPISDATLGPRIPDGNRVVLAAGTTYRMSHAADLTLAYEHLFVADRQIALNPSQPGNALRGFLGGATHSSVDVLGVQLTYRVN